jgi:NADPH:quinone reductase-like Zn-dependent oxidoreductase
MPRAVRFEGYGGIDVLEVVEVERPEPGRGQVLVRVRAAGINPGEAKIREGLLHDRWPATFPSGQGSDFAGVVEALGPDVVGPAPGDEVIGFTHQRASQADLVLAYADDLTARPSGVPWEVAGSLFVAGATAHAAVAAVDAQPGDVVVVSAAAGGVGSIVVQLLGLAGATVVGIAGPANFVWLESKGAIPVVHGDGVGDRIRAAIDRPVDAVIDTFGSGYVDLGLELGVAPERIDTIVDWDRAAEVGAKTDGNMAGARAEVLAELAALIDKGELEVPIAAVYPLDRVQDAYRQLETGHTRGKIVLVP